jgi:hypothetical protein
VRDAAAFKRAPQLPGYQINPTSVLPLGWLVVTASLHAWGCHTMTVPSTPRHSRRAYLRNSARRDAFARDASHVHSSASWQRHCWAMLVRMALLTHSRVHRSFTSWLMLLCCRSRGRQSCSAKLSSLILRHRQWGSWRLKRPGSARGSLGPECTGCIHIQSVLCGPDGTPTALMTHSRFGVPCRVKQVQPSTSPVLHLHTVHPYSYPGSP